jgi:hypothetical protein
MRCCLPIITHCRTQQHGAHFQTRLRAQSPKTSCFQCLIRRTQKSWLISKPKCRPVGILFLCKIFAILYIYLYISMQNIQDFHGFCDEIPWDRPTKYVGTINPLQFYRFDIQNRNKSGRPTYYLDVSGWSRRGGFHKWGYPKWMIYIDYNGQTY